MFLSSPSTTKAVGSVHGVEAEASIGRANGHTGAMVSLVIVSVEHDAVYRYIFEMIFPILRRCLWMKYLER